MITTEDLRTNALGSIIQQEQTEQIALTDSDSSVAVHSSRSAEIPLTSRERTKKDNREKERGTQYD